LPRSQRSMHAKKITNFYCFTRTEVPFVYNIPPPENWAHIAIRMFRETNPYAANNFPF
jgi:hypothetical protein